MSIKNYFELFTDAEKRHLPKELYTAGNTELLFQKRRVSVVGSRKASKDGLARAKIVARELVK
ncbi:DNA-processing protein DprA, partial [Croceitalea sp. MTPC9]